MHFSSIQCSNTRQWSGQKAPVDGRAYSLGAYNASQILYSWFLVV